MSLLDSERAAALKKAAREVVDAIVLEAGEAAEEVRALGVAVADTFEVAVLAGDPVALQDLERRTGMLAELARVHAVQAERQVTRQGILLAVRVARTLLFP